VIVDEAALVAERIAHREKPTARPKPPPRFVAKAATASSASPRSTTSARSRSLAAEAPRSPSHSTNARSSASGSADVLEALGFDLEQPAERIERSIDELGFGFLFAPSHHPAMRHAAPVRRELAARTVFNVLGPLTNPAGARAQVVGVYAPELVPTIAEVLAQLGSRRAFVVHGAGGVDELSPIGPNLVCEVADGKVSRREIDPLDFGVPRCKPGELAGGSPEENAAAIREIFAGGEGAKREAVLLNAGGAIAAGGHAEDLAEGYGIAARALDSGAAAERLDALIAFSQEKEAAA